MSMYNCCAEGVQFAATEVFSFLRRHCSVSNGAGVQRERYIQVAVFSELTYSAPAGKSVDNGLKLSTLFFVFISVVLPHKKKEPTMRSALFRNQAGYQNEEDEDRQYVFEAVH